MKHSPGFLSVVLQVSPAIRSFAKTGYANLRFFQINVQYFGTN
jgi:hypothetical protein